MTMAIIQSRAEIPTPWELAVECCTNATVESLAKLGRNEAQTIVYRNTMAKVRRGIRFCQKISALITVHQHLIHVMTYQVKQEYAGVEDYLKAKVFELKTQPGPDGKLVAIDETFPERRIIWRVNVSF